MIAVLLLVATVAVTQLNHPTVESDGPAKIVFGVDVTNTTAEPLEIRRLDFDMPYSPSGDWTVYRRRFVMRRAVAPGATVRIPVVQSVLAAEPGKATVRVEISVAGASGEHVVTLTQPIQLRIDRAVRVHP